MLDVLHDVTSDLASFYPTKDPDHLIDVISPLNVFYLFILVLTTIIGNVGNVMVIGAVFSDRKLRKEGNVLIVNLAIADLCVTGFVDPFSVAGVLIGHEWFLRHNTLCHIIGSICLISCVCSLWSIAAISLNRFILLCCQPIYPRIFTWRSTILMSLGLWLIALCLDLPNFLDWGDHTYDMKTMACSYDRLASYSYTVFFITLFVTIPLLVVLYCNTQIYIFVIRSKIRVASHRTKNFQNSTLSAVETSCTQTTMLKSVQQEPLISQNCKSIQSDEPSVQQPMKELKVVVTKESYSKKPKQTNQLLPGKKDIKQEVRLAKTLFIIFMVFCICWAPYALICLIDKDDLISKEIYTVAILMAHSSSSMNSILYAATNKGFRDGYRAFLFRCKIRY